jgi:hypothetical protein
MAPVLPCPFCGKPLDEFDARNEPEPEGDVRVLTYVHADNSRCQIRVPLEPTPRRSKAIVA